MTTEKDSLLLSVLARVKLRVRALSSTSVGKFLFLISSFSRFRVSVHRFVASLATTVALRVFATPPLSADSPKKSGLFSVALDYPQTSWEKLKLRSLRYGTPDSLSSRL